MAQPADLKKPLLKNEIQSTPGAAPVPGSDLAGSKTSQDSQPAAAPAPAPKPKPKKKSAPWPPDRERRTLKLATGLFFSYYCAACCTCLNPYDWVTKMFTCQQNEPDSWDSVDYEGRPMCTDHCSPLTLSLILGMFFTNVALVAFWWIGEYLITMFDVELRGELEGGIEWQKQQDIEELKHGLVPATERRKQPITHSHAWNEELLGWQERKKVASQQYSKALYFRAYFFYLLFFAISWFNQWLVLYIMPNNKSYSSPTIAGYIRQQVKGTVTPTLDGFYAYIIWTQFLLEFVLFCASAATVTWPRAAVVREHGLEHQAAVARVKMPTQAAHVLPQDESMEMIQDTCLMIACHKSVLSEERYDTFSNTLRAALAIFPAKAIFVCDNAPYRHPIDRTETVCKTVSLEKYPDGDQEINYVYIPEGNKSHAMYWTTEHWIPHLVEQNKIPNFQYAMMIDDDVPLPADLHVPLLTLSRNPDIKAYCYVICAATESGDDNNFLVNLQDAEYKFAGFTKQFQYQYGTTLCCHGAIALWRRDILGRQILWHHDTEFHGEDLYMGLLLHRMQKNYVIAVSAGAVVPTFAPETLLVLFRQRVTSWDLCAQRKIMTQLKMFCSGWCNMHTLILKPYMLQEVINVLLDWVRIYLLIGLAQRNFIGLCLCFFVFYSLLYVEVCIFNYGVLRKREDLQFSVKTILGFPFYRTLCLFFRVYALMRNILMYSTWRPKKLKISYREENQHDLPPVPLVAKPDWAVVWHSNTPTDNAPQPKISVFTDTLMKMVKAKEQDPIERRRLRCLIQATAMILKLQKENKKIGFPGTGDLKDDMKVISNALLEARASFLRRIRTMVAGTHNSRFEQKLHENVNGWDATGPHLFYKPGISTSNPKWESIFATSNLHVLKQIEQLLFQTKYPATHDQVAALKNQVKNLITHFEYKCHFDRARETRDQALRSLLDKIENVKQVITERNVPELSRALDTLNAIEGKAETLVLSQQWKTQIRKVVRKYRAAIRDLLEKQGIRVQDDEQRDNFTAPAPAASPRPNPAPVPAAAPAPAAPTHKRQRSVMVTCPVSAKPGMRLRITTNDGQKITATVPEGTEPGQKFKVQYDAAPAAPVDS